MVLSRNLIIQFNFLRKLWILYLFSSQKVSLVFLLLFAIWVIFQASYSTLVPWILKNTKRDFSTTHSPCRQRRKPLGAGYPTDHSGIMALLNSMVMRKWRGNLQATQGLGYSHSSLLHLVPSLFQTHLLYREDFILLSSQLGQVWSLILWDAYHHPAWWLERFYYQGWKYQSSESNENVSSPHPTSRSSPNINIQVDPQSHLMRGLAEGFKVPLWNVHMIHLCFYSTLVSMLPKFNKIMIILNVL